MVFRVPRKASLFSTWDFYCGPNSFNSHANPAQISGIGVSLIYGWNYHQCGYCDSACYSSGASSDMESARPLEEVRVGTLLND